MLEAKDSPAIRTGLVAHVLVVAAIGTVLLNCKSQSGKETG
jgi:hypothetical protein